MIVLAIVSGMARGSFSPLHMGLVVVEAVAFTVFVVVVGRRAMVPLWSRFPKLHIPRPAFAVGVALCLGLSAAASYIGLAAIIGAFLAGLVFAEAEDASQLRRTMQPIYDFFVPIFFVIMGSKVDVPRLLSLEILPLGLLVTALALAGKFIGCGLASVGLGKRNAVAIGVGMAPRGEVGIVVAMVGLSSGVISGDIFSVVIMMSVLTTFLTPLLLRLLLVRRTVVV
jgi:Kef-type K+ transport system membrane component KefB